MIRAGIHLNRGGYNKSNETGILEVDAIASICKTKSISIAPGVLSPYLKV